MKFGRAFSLASHLRQSYRAPIARECLTGRELYALRCVVTVSRSGHFVAFIRLRNSVSSASGKFKTLNGRNCICLLAGSLCSTGLGHGVLLLSSFWILRPTDLAIIVFYVPRRTSSVREWENAITKRTLGALSPVSRLVGSDLRASHRSDGIRARRKLSISPVGLVQKTALTVLQDNGVLRSGSRRSGLKTPSVKQPKQNQSDTRRSFRLPL